MKPSAKSSVALASMLFLAVFIIVALVQSWLDYYKSARTRNLRRTLMESVFTSDGSLAHVVGYVDPRINMRSASQVYDETLLVKNLSVLPKAFDKEYQAARISMTAVSEKEPDWWSRRAWRNQYSFLWWNGAEGQFDLYDLGTRLRSESIGPDGDVAIAPGRPKGRIRLCDPIPSREGYTYMLGDIPTPNDEACLLITDDGILRLNPNPRSLSLERLFHGRVEGWGVRRGQDHQVACLWLISGGALWQLDFHGPPVRKIPLSDELTQSILAWTNTIVPLENGGFSIATRDTRDNWWNDRWRENLFLLSSDGSVLRRVEIDRNELNSRINADYGVSRAILMPLALLLLPMWKLTTAALIESVILSLALTLLVTWHQARTGRRGWRAIAWPAFTFLTGLAGAGAYVIAHWDKRTEACPGCGKRRPIAQDTCPHCNIPWPKPAKSGFEVLEAR